jgi:hypothetical protein
MVVRMPKRDAADAVRFVAHFGGVVQAEAYLEMVFLAPTLTQAQAVAAVFSPVAGGPARQCGERSNRRFAWSIAECEFAYRTKTGSRVAGLAALGRHGGRYFKLTLHYPLEYGGGFVPRADLVLAEWRWQDTNTGL